MANDLQVDLGGKTALITGASSGFGVHFATVLAKAGANVILAARRTSALETTAAAARAFGVAALTVALDVTSAVSVSELSAVISDIDILVNNAGIARNGMALDQSEQDWDDVIDTNLKGMFLVAQASARTMKESKKGGTIINIASVLGLRQASTVLPYAVSKAGVIQMTKVLALECARYNVRVNALAPGYFDTELNRDFWQSDAGKALIARVPQRRLGNMSDLDGPLLLLASDASRFMTGAVLVVDGGHMVSTL